MERGTTNNQSTNSSDIVYGDNASPIFAFLSMALFSWIILSNLFVLIFLIKHRNHLIKSTFTMQILTLNASDFLVGISALPTYITASAPRVSFEECMFRLVFFISAQAVVLFHITGICINRLLIVCKLTSQMSVPKSRLCVVILHVTNWIITLGIFSVPFGIWGKYRSYVSICSLNEIFQDKYKLYAIYLLSFYTVPSILTNAVYLAIILKLRFSSRKISSDNSLDSKKNSLTQRVEHTQSSDSSPRGAFKTKGSRVQAWSKTSANLKSNTRCSQLADVIATSESGGVYALAYRQERIVAFAKDRSNNSENTDSQKCFSHYSNYGQHTLKSDMHYRSESDDTTSQISVALRSSDKKHTVERHQNYNKGPESIASETSDYVHSSHSSCKTENENQPSSNNTEDGNDTQQEKSFLRPFKYSSQPTFKSQRKALITVGLVLCVYDVCVIPFLVVFAVDCQVDYEISRNWKLLVTTLLTVNSAINPFIYTWKFASFRKALRQTFQSLRRRLC